MDRKTVLALSLCIGVVWFWTRFVMIPPAEDPAANKTAAAHKDTQGKDGKSAAGDGKSVAADGKPAAADGKTVAGDGKTAGDEVKGGVVVPAQPRQPEALTTIELPGRARATLSSWGAALHDHVLLDKQHKETSGDHDVPIDLVASKDPPLPFAVTFPDSGFELAPDADYRLEASPDGNERRYVWASGPVQVEKRWRFLPNSYQAELTVTLSNTGEQPIPAQLRLSLAGRQEPGVEPSILRPSVVQTEGVCSTGKVRREPLSSLIKEPVEIGGPVRFIAIDRKYFVLAAAIAPDDQARCRIEATASGRITTTLTLPARPVAPGGKRTWTFTTFMGPKFVRELDDAKVTTEQGAVDAHLGDVMNYGFTEIFARPMLWVLKAVHRGLGNWGIAIILLTVLIKLVTWWPTAQSMKSAASMAKLKPEMDKLKEKYGDDKARMNQEVMALYQKHKINPLGGCLPVLIQMPIYIALYSMLGNSVELYRAHFGLWIHDLTGPDPYFVLPLLTGAIMFLQQKLSPTAIDPSQKTMMTMMPLMFTGMSIFLPAGLTLYILTNTALSMVQQRISTPPTATPAAAPTPATKAKKKADQ